MTRVEIHGKLCDGLKDLYSRKNADYGDSFAKIRRDHPDAICVRLGDKFHRLEMLLKQGYAAKVADESIEDTLTDLANYALMELTERAMDKQEETSQNAVPYEPMHSELVWSIADDGTQFVGDDGRGRLTAADLWRDSPDGKYELLIETGVRFETPMGLVKYLWMIRDGLNSFAEKTEPGVTYKMTTKDYLGREVWDNGLVGDTITEVAKYFEYAVENLKRSVCG